MNLYKKVSEAAEQWDYVTTEEITEIEKAIGDLHMDGMTNENIAILALYIYIKEHARK